MKFSQCLSSALFLALLTAASLSIPLVAAEQKFYVCYINTTQKEVLQGKTVTVIFGVFYSSPYYAPCGEPCILKPRTGQTQTTASFEIRGSPALRFTDIPVTPTGKPGEYRAEVNWPTDAPIGKITAFVIKDSLYDGKTAGPEKETSHTETPDPIDDSTFTSVRSVHPVVAMFEPIPGGIAMVAGLIILLVVLLLFFAKRRTKKQ